MSCTICTKTKPIPQCSGILTIGAVTPAEVIVVVTEIITGRRKVIDGTVTIGILTVDLADLGDFLSPNLVYNIEVFEDMEGYGEPVTVTIGAEEYTCLSLTVQSVMNTDGEIEGAATFVLKIDE